MNRRTLNRLLAVLSGVMMSLAFPPAGWDFLAFVSLVPLFFALKECDLKSSFLLSYISGLVFFGCLLYWLVNVTVPGTVALVMIMAVFFGMFGILANIVFRYSMEFIVLPFIWVVTEYLRSHCFFNGFPWGLLAYTQYKSTGFIQIADITGAYGVSFILVFLNVAFFGFLSRDKKRRVHAITALVLVILSTGYGFYKASNSLITDNPAISVVQGNIPQKFKWDAQYADSVVGTYLDLTKKAAAETSSLIIWPETAYPYLAKKGEEPAEMGNAAKEAARPLLAGVVYNDKDKYFNSAMLFSDKGGVTAEYFKIHLVPFGEYIPFEKYLGFMKNYINKPVGDFAAGREYTLFPLRSVRSSTSTGGEIIRRVSFHKFGVLICFEDVFPYLSREFALKGADLLVNITNDAWFGDTAAPEQHLQASVFRAVENRVPVVRAANTGISCFIDPMGAVTQRVKKNGKDSFVEGYATANVRIFARRSFYTYHGDYFSYFCGFVVLIFFIMAPYEKKNR